jgi:hypothetical protein
MPRFSTPVAAFSALEGKEGLFAVRDPRWSVVDGRVRRARALRSGLCVAVAMFPAFPPPVRHRARRAAAGVPRAPATRVLVLVRAPALTSCVLHKIQNQNQNRTRASQRPTRSKTKPKARGQALAAYDRVPMRKEGIRRAGSTGVTALALRNA